MLRNNIHNESHQQSIEEILNKQCFYYFLCSGNPEPSTLNEGFQARGATAMGQLHSSNLSALLRRKLTQSWVLLGGSAVSFSYKGSMGWIKEHVFTRKQNEQTSSLNTLWYVKVIGLIRRDAIKKKWRNCIRTFFYFKRSRLHCYTLELYQG